ncbi:hypothetical protein GALMADRAFT_144079 [Galerina marginata CBS 339.88]|uniref:Uncharacterized protein n=1 Tax=Galerina marginata (strain CBS 339.88) TaxID=685588 RepID=A0A067STJ3_GALM3|nr:hypothetical protein GALMADRAFT_144079 [Galerina marginata CBS 339.88]
MEVDTRLRFMLAKFPRHNSYIEDEKQNLLLKGIPFDEIEINSPWPGVYDVKDPDEETVQMESSQPDEEEDDVLLSESLAGENETKESADYKGKGKENNYYDPNWDTEQGPLLRTRTPFKRSKDLFTGPNNSVTTPFPRNHL